MHTCLDCACTVVTLFYSSSSSKSDLCFVISEERSTSNKNAVPEGQIENDVKSNGKLRRMNAVILGLYPSLFKDSILEEHPAILSRVLMYWIAAMGLTRLMAVCWPCTPTLITVAIMYALEALALEYEGFTFQTAKSEYVRKVSIFSIGMCVISCLMAIFI